MTQDKVTLFLATYAKYFSQQQTLFLADQLNQLDDQSLQRVFVQNYKDPVIALIISLAGGPFGIDRIYIGDTGLGLLKLFTCGGLGIWTLIDFFLIMDAAKEKNDQLLQQALAR